MFPYSDGRLRIGDEIVNVNGHHLRGIQSLQAVQQMLATFVDNAVDLVIAHDELTTFAGDHHHAASSLHNLRNSRNLNESYKPVDLQATHLANCEIERNVKKRLSFNDSIGIDSCLATTVHVDGIDRVDSADRLYKTQQESRADRRRSSLNRSLALTPLFNSSEYIPVYANRVMITNTASDDEKWQLLSRKRSDQLSATGYQMGADESTQYSDKVERMNANETVYALCRPHNKSQPLSISRSTINLVADHQDPPSQLYRPEAVLDHPSLSQSHGFPLQKSQTESCLPLATTLSSAATNHTQQLYVQNVPEPDAAVPDVKCEQTISIQIGNDGDSYVEG